MGILTINGKTYTGNSIRISGNEVWIDGRKADSQPEPINGVLTVNINRSIESLYTDFNVNMTGSVGNVDSSGNVNCGNVAGNVKSQGNVICGNVSGNVLAGGNVIRK